MDIPFLLILCLLWGPDPTAWTRQAEVHFDIEAGNRCQVSGNLDSAMAYFDRARDLCIDGGDRSTTYECICRISNLLLQKEQYREADSLLSKARRDGTQDFGESHIVLATMDDLLGATSSLEGKDSLSCEHHRHAISIREAQVCPDSDLLAENYYHLGLDLIRAHDRGHAEAAFRRGISLTAGSSRPASRAILAWNQECLAESMLAKGRNDSSLALCESALATEETMNNADTALAYSTFRLLGDALQRMSDIPAALIAYQNALIAIDPQFQDTTWGSNALPPSVEKLDAYVRILIAKASALETLFAHTMGVTPYRRFALAALTSAARAMAQVRLLSSSDQPSAGLRSLTCEVELAGFTAATRLFDETGELRFFDSALQFAERKRAENVCNEMHRSGNSRFKDIPAPSPLRLAKRVERLMTKVQGIDTHALPPDNGGARRRLHEADEELRRTQDSLFNAHPAYYAACDESHPACIKSIQRVLAPDECLLEYVWGRNSLDALTITKDTVAYRAITLPGMVEPLLNKLQQSVWTKNDRGYVAAARGLYQLLIEPQEEVIGHIERMVIVPDGVLANLPFESLVSASPKKRRGKINFAKLHYLLNNHEISYALSVSSFVAERERIEDDPATEMSFAGFAPVLGDSSSNRFGLINTPSGLRSVRATRKSAKPLPYSADEVKNISRGFNSIGGSGVAFLSRDASLRNFTLNAGGCAFLHIATHGILDDRYPGHLALVFAGSADSSGGDDGLLYDDDAYGLHLKTRLVVLSSCGPGSGRLAGSDGNLVMARGFYYAGAHSLLYSLWNVSDKPTSELMQHFYSGVWKHERLSAALREAKLGLVKNPKTAYPMCWAGFILLGR